jgi:hypothetical protein
MSERLLFVRFGAYVVLALGLSVLPGCSRDGTGGKPQQPLSKAQLQEILGPTKEQVALLAAKASLDEGVVRQILVTYLETHDLAYGLLAGVEGDTKKQSALLLDPEAKGRITDTIQELAGRHNLPASQVAAILIDYRIWHACKRSE